MADCFLYFLVTNYVNQFKKALRHNDFLYFAQGYLSKCNIDSVDWTRVVHLYIWGCDTGDQQKYWGYLPIIATLANDCASFSPVMNGNTNAVPNGIYTNEKMTRVYAYFTSTEVSQKLILQCAKQLEVLDVQWTQLESIDVSHLKNLKTLILPYNTKLKSIDGLQQLTKLEKMDISDTAVGPILDLSNMVHIKKLRVSFGKILNTLKGLRNACELNEMNLSSNERGFSTSGGMTQWLVDNMLEKTESNKVLPIVTNVKPYYSFCKKKNNALVDKREEFLCKNVFKLRDRVRKGLSENNAEEKFERKQPQQLACVLYGIRKKEKLKPIQIPEEIRYLKSLRLLNLSGLLLEELPTWLPDLGLEFRHTGTSGIILNETGVVNVDMSIFNQSQEVILQWFEERKRNAGAPLNEVKVVFLGDGEAGKTHTIARLLKGGEMLTPDETPGDATPGIVITDQPYDLDDRRIQVHFWDFGGQEILHSMHRMFLTERTLYIVLLNARDNTQNERARYWLHNIRSFAGDAPVLLVLNKTDQNAHATVNISDLREICPNLPEAVYLSALRDSPAEFNRKLTGAMLDAIRKIDTIRTFFPNSWKQVKDALQTMETPYIKGDAYKRLCDDNRVDEKIQRDVLDLFKTLGVSFYYPGVKLEDYVVLRPDWITNAIYIILFNKRNEVKNGLISHDTIYRLLNPRPGDAVKRVLPDATYSNDEVTYVLDVVRRFRLSYQVETDLEFIPMLCDSNSLPVAGEYAADPDNLEFRMKFDYLPNNVIHRLMVELRLHLDQDHVWLTGALFREKSKGFSAVVKTEGNLLRIFVRAEKPRYTADMYLDTIRDALERINGDMGLKVAENQVVYKADSIVECFDYDDLILSQELGDTMVTSRVRRKKVPIADILSQTDHRVDKARETLIGDVLSACRSLQANALYWKAKEDDRNTFIRDILRAKGYIVSDQTRSGISAGGKQAGELDLDIRQEPDMPWTILEALNLSGKEKSQIAYWDEHLKKLLDNYNANGLPFLLHVSYLACPKDKFGAICAAYSDHLRFHSPAQYNLQLRTAPEGYGENHFIREYQCVYDCNGDPTTVFHFFVRMGE